MKHLVTLYRVDIHGVEGRENTVFFPRLTHATELVETTRKKRRAKYAAEHEPIHFGLDAKLSDDDKLRLCVLLEMEVRKYT